jgi:hypothetical protein
MESRKFVVRLNTVIASLLIACFGGSCGSPENNTAVEPPLASDQIEPTTASPPEGDVLRWADLLRSAPINEIYDRDYPAELAQLADTSDFQVTGRIASVELAKPQATSFLPDPATEPLPFEPDLVVRGITIVLTNASVIGADGPALGLSGGSLRVDVPLFSGPRTSKAADEFIAKVAAEAPIGAAVVGFGMQAGVRAGGVNVGPYGLFVAAEGSEPALPADPGLDATVGGRTYDQLIADTVKG